jgi:hypothetical protein
MAFSYDTYVGNAHAEQAFSPVEPPSRHQPSSSGPSLPSVSLALSGNGSPQYAEPHSNKLDHPAARDVGSTAAVPPGYVPADLANQRLWSVTTEYENFLRLQKEHQLLTAQRRETEIKHLKAVTEMLTGEVNEEDAIAARLHARDQEVAATQKAKQAELELLGAVLVLRDRQIGDLQRMCESKRCQISQLQQRNVATDPRKADAWKDVQQLRDRILNMESAVGDKRSELRCLAESLDAKTLRVDALHAEVVEAEQQVRQMAGGPVPMRKLDVLPESQHQLLQIPDGSGAVAGRLPSKVEAMQQQLAQAQQRLQHMVRANVENDNIVRGLAGMSPELQEGSRNVSPSAPPKEPEHPDHSQTGSASPLWSAVLGHLGVSSLPSSPHSLGVQKGGLSWRQPQGHEQRYSRQLEEILALSEVEPVSPPVGAVDLQASTTFKARPTMTSSSVEAQSSLQAPVSSTATTSPPATLAASAARSASPARPATDEPWHSYQAHPGDAVDAMVASFVNQPRNRLRRSLFCRTGPGEYLYGTRKVHLRISRALSGSSQLEACEAELESGDDTLMYWAPIEEFTRRLERAQSNNLHRARERVRAGVVGKM